MWTDDLVEQPRDLWSDGVPTAEIGRRLGVTKNAVVGKAGRLGLAPRPSPLGISGGWQHASNLSAKPRVRAPRASRAEAARIPTAMVVVEPDPAEPVVVFRPRQVNGGCRWIEGQPSGERTMFCGEARRDHSCPYCVAHARRAYARAAVA